MITKERLKELAEQNEMFYMILNHSIIVGMKILKLEKIAKYYVIDIEYCDDFYDEIEIVDVHKGDKDKLSFDSLNHLYETKEQAEWAIDFQRIKRTEYLNLPSWEEFKELGYYKFSSSRNEPIVIEVVINLSIYEDVKSQNFIELSKQYDFSHESLFRKAYNKKNYIKACEMAKRLFLGKEEK